MEFAMFGFVGAARNEALQSSFAVNGPCFSSLYRMRPGGLVSHHLKGSIDLES